MVSTLKILLTSLKLKEFQLKFIFSSSYIKTVDISMKTKSSCIIRSPILCTGQLAVCHQLLLTNGNYRTGEEKRGKCDVVHVTIELCKDYLHFKAGYLYYRLYTSHCNLYTHQRHWSEGALRLPRTERTNFPSAPLM